MRCPVPTRTAIDFAKRKRLSEIALIISIIILISGIAAFALQIARPNFDKEYDSHHSQMEAIETGEVNTHLNNLMNQNTAEIESITGMGLDAAAAQKALKALEDSLKNAQETANKITLALAEEEQSFDGPFMFMARHRMLILATGVILLVISLLFYIANNKTKSSFLMPCMLLVCSAMHCAPPRYKLSKIILLPYHILQGCYDGIHGGFGWIMAGVWDDLASDGVVAFCCF